MTEVAVNWHKVHFSLRLASGALRQSHISPASVAREPIGPFLSQAYGIDTHDPYQLSELFQCSEQIGTSLKATLMNEKAEPELFEPKDTLRLINRVVLIRAVVDLRLGAYIPEPYDKKPAWQRISMPPQNPDSWRWSALRLSPAQWRHHQAWLKESEANATPADLNQRIKEIKVAQAEIARSPLLGFQMLAMFHLYQFMLKAENRRRNIVAQDRLDKFFAIMLGEAYTRLPADYKILTGLRR